MCAFLFGCMAYQAMKYFQRVFKNNRKQHPANAIYRNACDELNPDYFRSIILLYVGYCSDDYTVLWGFNQDHTEHVSISLCPENVRQFTGAINTDVLPRLVVRLTTYDTLQYIYTSTLLLLLIKVCGCVLLGAPPNRGCGMKHRCDNHWIMLGYSSTVCNYVIILVAVPR